MQLTQKQVDADIARFIAGLGGSRGRWMYCLDTMSTPVRSRYTGMVRTVVAAKGKGAATRIVNNWMSEANVYRTLCELRRTDGASYEELNRPHVVTGEPRLNVGPLPAWSVGHVYFLRVVSHPHVVKVGFSRRVVERIDDIRSKAKTSLDLFAARPGTLLDEQKWHRSLRSTHIDGEWFFDPDTSDRTLPSFLEAAAKVAA